MRQEHGWRLTDIGWTPEVLFPQRTGALKGAVLWDTWGSGLSIIALQEADSGLKQWALYHYIASLGDGTADTDGWLTMTVHDGGFKHTAQKAEHISKGSVLALTLVAGRSNGCFFMVQQPCPGSLSTGLLANACTITYLTRWKERGTIKLIPELVHNLASAPALRASLLLLGIIRKQRQQTKNISCHILSETALYSSLDCYIYKIITY